MTASYAAMRNCILRSIPSAPDLGAADKVRVLAINSAKRMPQLPDMPTIAEAGCPDYQYDFVVRRDGAGRTPKPILDKISQDIATVLQMPT